MSADVDLAEFARRLPNRPLRLDELAELLEAVAPDASTSAGGPASVVAFWMDVDGRSEAYEYVPARGRWVVLDVDELEEGGGR